MKRKVLCLVMALSLFTALFLPASAVPENNDKSEIISLPASDGSAPDNTALKNADGLESSKTIITKPDGSLAVRLEAYVTGKVSSTTQTSSVPLDTVFVLDTSASMAPDTNKDTPAGTGAESSLLELSSSVQQSDIDGLDTEMCGDLKRNYYIRTSISSQGIRYCPLRYHNGKWQISKGQGYQSYRPSKYDKLYISKLGAVRLAAKAFVDELAQDSAEHRIALVEYDSDSNVLMGLTYASSGKDSITDAIKNLDAGGVTKPQKGLADALNILSGSSGEKVCVFFTDAGATDLSDIDYNETVSKGKALKNIGVSVYCVGMFNGADVNGSDKPNLFMSYVSSNYPNAENFDNPGEKKASSYYMTAANADGLKSAFKTISSEIINITPRITLGADTTVFDKISEYFEIPGGVSAVSIQKIPCTGQADGVFSFDDSKAVPAPGAAAELAENTVSVRGFDFSSDENVVTEKGGYKLRVEFPLKAKDGFLGGSGVRTNCGGGIIPSGETSAIEEFPDRTADIPLKDISGADFVIPDKNVYYASTLSTGELLSGAVLKEKGKTLFSLDKEQLGLEKWQYAYADIDIAITPLTGTVMTADTAYSVSLCIKDCNNNGNSKTASADARVYVFVPYTHFSDYSVYFDDEAPTYAPVCTEWKNSALGKTAAEVTMTGEKPELSFSYQPQNALAVQNGRIAVHDDYYVKVSALANGIDAGFFTHSCDNGSCSFDKEKGTFMVHVSDRLGDLRITKSFAEGTAADPSQTYVFHIKGEDKNTAGVNISVVIQGGGSVTVKDLLVGEYSVSEDTSWSWRYSPDTAALSLQLSQNTVCEAEFTNTLSRDKWLSSEALARNVFAAAN